MARPTKFSQVKKEILEVFKKTKKTIFSDEEIVKIFHENRDTWGLAKGMTLYDFKENLFLYTDFKDVSLEFLFRRYTRSFYGYGEPPLNILALSLKKNSYLSHYSAVVFHNLTEQIPKTIFVSSELSKKIEKESSLTQEKIKEALSKEQRTSSQQATINDYTIYLLEGKYTGQKGIITQEDAQKNNIRVTDLERTLIDIAVRPNYAGGIYEVLKAYENAVDNVSINRLNSYLKHLNFIYPYEQVIGFYLEKTGVYRDTQIDLLKRDFEYDFYLTYAMKDMEYSQKWRLFYPKGF